ncbi:carbon-phosphorus lyase [Burkholderia singularis]|uniref:Alpha-D-ribose 1-methylphosphonate 5-phosphate C-P lyase n=1 Tax=Burkholderia singularis TaxID=1503053 RepID=A0A103E460_9BURK|nr:carbon-phosphorus lyase [Burkholderia singularis]
MNAPDPACTSTSNTMNAAHDAGSDAACGYNFAYLDEQTKRMIRRALLKAVAVPGYQVPFASREMPLPFGWGTGGIQVTAALIGTGDTLKVIDQGCDATTNAVNIRRFFARCAGVATTTRTADASIIQTRHRIPETPLTERQILVYQVPMPEPLFRLEPRTAECAKLHAFADYGLMHVRLYEDLVRHGRIATTYNYPVIVNDRYLMSPSPIPKFDNPKLHMNPALQLFGAGRERRIYAIAPYTKVVSLDFDDHPFEIQRWDAACALCGSRESFLDEMIVDDHGTRRFVCSDSDYCESRDAAQSADAGAGTGGIGGADMQPPPRVGIEQPAGDTA